MLKKRFILLIAVIIVLFTIIKVTNAFDINFIFGKDITINNINSNNIIINSKDVKNIDDSDVLDKFTHLRGYKDISFDVSSDKEFNLDEIKEINSNSGNKVNNIFELNNLEIETEYKEADTSFFNINEKSVKQTYIIKNLLDEKRNIKLNIKYEIDSSVIKWNGTEHEIISEPKYFKAFYAEDEIFLGISEPSLMGYTLYFDEDEGTSYYDFKDIVNLDYKVSVYSKDNKNYIDLEVIFDINSLEEFVIDPEIGWTTHIISTSASGAWGVYAIDVDGDEDIDVLSASMSDDSIVWYENDGNIPPTWTARNITTSADVARVVYAIDLDNDTDIDVLSASYYDDKIAWYENDGSSPPGWTTRIITTSADGAEDVYAIDLDNDNDVDVLSASFYDGTIAWYENDGGTPPNWTNRVVDSISNSDASAVHATDIDNDGNIDVIGGFTDNSKVIWYENSGDSPPNWTAHTVTTNIIGTLSVYAEDIDSDNDMDILTTSVQQDKVAWHENNGGSPPTWTERIITSSANWVTDAYARDIDGDEDIDVLSASREDDKVAWYENDGSSPPSWTARIITTSANGATGVFATDLDNDDDIDVLSASNYDNKVAWYESDLISTPKLKILAVPLNWSGSQESFNNVANEQIDFFVDDTNLVSCPNRVDVDILSIESQNFEDFDGGMGDCKIFSIDYFVLQQLGLDYFDYDIILGITDYPPNINYGCHAITKTSWVGVNEASNYTHLAAHEIGHQFGLEDEYCSNPAGSNDCRCNSGPNIESCLIGGFIPWSQQDINYLDANLGCNASEGGGCCEVGILPSCDSVNYEICCLGNTNSLGGVATMSFTDADILQAGSRGYDAHSKAHLATFSKLNCGGPGTPIPAVDINFLLYKNDSVLNITIRQVNATVSVQTNESGNYNLSIFDNQSNQIFNTPLDISFEYTGPVLLEDNLTQNISYDFIDFNYKIPFNSSMYNLTLYKNNTAIYSKILDFCDNNLICDNTETYLTCPLDCPLNQTDNICIAEDDGFCDPDCAFGVDVNCALDLVNLTIPYKNATNVIFKMDVNNFANQTIENISWSLNTGESEINSTLNVTLESLKDIFIFIEYNYNNTGNYTVVATVKSGFLIDNESINIEI